MEKDGYKRIHNIDISAVLIERMIEEMGEGRGGIEWQVMDCRSMEFEDETFDRVLDKGCMDTVLATEESERAGEWIAAALLSHTLVCKSLKTQAHNELGFSLLVHSLAVASYLSHVSRVLRPAGKFILVSLSPPSTNLPFLSNEDFSWSVECTELVKPVIGGEREKMNLSEDPKSAHYLYVCTMGNDCE